MQTLSESQFSSHRESKSRIESINIVIQLNASYVFKLNLKSQHAVCLLETTLVLHFPAGSSQFLTFSINSTKGRLILKSFLFPPFVWTPEPSLLLLCVLGVLSMQATLTSEKSHARFVINTQVFFYIYICTAYNCQIAQTTRHKRAAVILFLLPHYRRIIAFVTAEINALSALKPAFYLAMRVVLSELVMPYLMCK